MPGQTFPARPRRATGPTSASRLNSGGPPTRDAPTGTPRSTCVLIEPPRRRRHHAPGRTETRTRPRWPGAGARLHRRGGQCHCRERRPGHLPPARGGHQGTPAWPRRRGHYRGRHRRAAVGLRWRRRRVPVGLRGQADRPGVPVRPDDGRPHLQRRAAAAPAHRRLRVDAATPAVAIRPGRRPRRGTSRRRRLAGRSESGRVDEPSR
jgi:hypothetical protein